jgi:hypothetical protein
VKLSKLERRRQRLSRHYDLAAQHRMRRGGYSNSGHSPLSWRLWRDFIELQTLPHYWAEAPRWRLWLRSFAGSRVLPDFCVVGPIKAGTSDLAISLLLHPNVLTPLAKEFWSIDPASWRKFYPTERRARVHAHQHGIALAPYFVPCMDRFDLIYSLSQLTPKRKVVIMLRNPVERFFSHWKWERLLAGKHVVATLPFLGTFSNFVDESLALFPELVPHSTSGFSPLHSSIYWKSVSQWIRLCGAGNVLVLDVADYFRSRDECLRRIQDFVGLPYRPTTEFSTRVNENPLEVQAADEASLERLREFFGPHNQSLWQVIGKVFDW